jgi:methionyl-tRNA formyltransferase
MSDTVQKTPFVFFGTSEFSAHILDELEKQGFVPHAIISAEDKPVGRKMIITPPATKVWATSRNIKVLQPKTLRETKEIGITEKIKTFIEGCDLFIVASYGKIIPQAILDLPKHGTLNVHPSLLPKLRGPSPMVSAILSENETGVSIMLLDADMDHGPLLAQEKTVVSEWPPYIDELETTSAVQGARMLTEIIPNWIAGTLKGVEQDHTQATICKKISKEDGLLTFTDSADNNLRKIRAFQGWPTSYFFMEKDAKQMRIIVTKAHVENDQLIIDSVIPEGKKEMLYADFMRGF